jgi:hypothetical protein
MKRNRPVVARLLLDAFKRARDNAPRQEFRDDLTMLQSKDLDLSVRLGALLAFDALLLTAAINPIAASPGAPLSLDAPTQPWEVALVSLGIILLAISAIQCVRGILVGEEFEADPERDSAETIRERMYQAYVESIDTQMRMIRLASRFAIIGSAVTIIACLWIMAEKIWG